MEEILTLSECPDVFFKSLQIHGYHLGYRKWHFTLEKGNTESRAQLEAIPFLDSWIAMTGVRRMVLDWFCKSWSDGEVRKQQRIGSLPRACLPWSMEQHFFALLSLVSWILEVYWSIRPWTLMVQSPANGTRWNMLASIVNTDNTVCLREFGLYFYGISWYYTKIDLKKPQRFGMLQVTR